VTKSICSSVIITNAPNIVDKSNGRVRVAAHLSQFGRNEGRSDQSSCRPPHICVWVALGSFDELMIPGTVATCDAKKGGVALHTVPRRHTIHRFGEVVAGHEVSTVVEAANLPATRALEGRFDRHQASP
jgi:hypothetical protein